MGGKSDLLDSGIGTDAAQILGVLCNQQPVYNPQSTCLPQGLFTRPGGGSTQRREVQVSGRMATPNEHLTLYDTPSPPRTEVMSQERPALLQTEVLPWWTFLCAVLITGDIADVPSIAILLVLFFNFYYWI